MPQSKTDHSCECRVWGARGINNIFFQEVTPCDLVEIYETFWEFHWLRLRNRWSQYDPPKSLVNLQESVWHDICKWPITSQLHFWLLTFRIRPSGLIKIYVPPARAVLYNPGRKGQSRGSCLSAISQLKKKN